MGTVTAAKPTLNTSHQSQRCRSITTPASYKTTSWQVKMKSPGRPALLVFLLVVDESLGMGGDQAYCRFSQQHTLCRHHGVGPQCSRVGDRGLRKEEQKQVVDHHNRLRSRVASGLTQHPPAANMRQLEWDPELARVAQRLADQCNFAHDCSDCRRVGRFTVGQNLYQSFTARAEEKADWIGAIESWFNEIELLPTSSISSYSFSPSTGHFSQLAWASTDKIGCGVTQYPNGRFMARLYVCNYGPSGNLIGSPIYSAGRQCSACPTGFSCSSAFPGLCSPSSMGGKPMESENEISNLPLMNGFRPMIQSTTEKTPESVPISSQPLIISQSQDSSPTRPLTSLPSQPIANFSPSQSLPSPPLPSFPPSRPSQQSRPTFQNPPSSRPRPSTSCSSFFCLLTRPGAILMNSLHNAMNAVNSGFRFP